MGDEEKGFTIKDRRFFSEESEEPASEPAAESEPEAAQTEPEAADAPDAAQESVSPLPEIDFSTFIFSLNSSALIHLGLIEEPTTQQKTKNLPLAKQTIDLIGMLEEKTRGNLTGDEEQLLKNILHDLRLMYVKACS